MSGSRIPNDDLGHLAALLGEDNVRQLVRTFLREYPLLIQQLAAGDRKTRHRIAHSLKSNARVIGARELSAHMAALEERLNDASQPDLQSADVADVGRRFDAAAEPLRDFVRDA